MLLALGAEAISGAELVMDRVGFAQGLARADVCVTAEGHVDMQTLDGKVVVRVAERCREAGVQCFAVGGRVDPDAAAALAGRGCEAVESSDLVAGGHMLTTRYP
jgi:glycerate 2-kinase